MPRLPPSSSCASSQLQNGWTGAIWAATHGHLDALCTLLVAGANPVAADVVRR